MSNIGDWQIVNDGVMGGLSESRIVLSDRNTALFSGNVSLENGGGFASTRTEVNQFELDRYKGILIRVKGDGRRYQFRIRTGGRFDRVSYRYHFDTNLNQWETIKVPFKDCVPVFRGRVLQDVASISPNDIRQLGVLISDKQAGEFQLEIKWIKAYR
jgi:monofunctional biosynthetic peptidoglycan transglycosylase